MMCLPVKKKVLKNRTPELGEIRGTLCCESDYVA